MDLKKKMKRAQAAPAKLIAPTLPTDGRALKKVTAGKGNHTLKGQLKLDIVDTIPDSGAHLEFKLMNLDHVRRGFKDNTLMNLQGQCTEIMSEDQCMAAGCSWGWVPNVFTFCNGGAAQAPAAAEEEEEEEPEEEEEETEEPEEEEAEEEGEEEEEEGEELLII